MHAKRRAQATIFARRTRVVIVSRAEVSRNTNLDKVFGQPTPGPSIELLSDIALTALPLHLTPKTNCRPSLPRRTVYDLRVRGNRDDAHHP